MIYALYITFTLLGFVVCFALKKHFSGPDLNAKEVFICIVAMMIIGGQHYSIALNGEVLLVGGEARYMFSNNDFFATCSFFAAGIHAFFLFPSKRGV